MAELRIPSLAVKVALIRARERDYTRISSVSAIELLEAAAPLIVAAAARAFVEDRRARSLPITPGAVMAWADDLDPPGGDTPEGGTG